MVKGLTFVHYYGGGPLKNPNWRNELYEAQVEAMMEKVRFFELHGYEFEPPDFWVSENGINSLMEQTMEVFAQSYFNRWPQEDIQWEL